LRIVSVDVYLSDEPAFTPEFKWRKGLPGSEGPSVSGWLVLTTDAGIRGYAHCRRGLILADLVDRRLRNELAGSNPLHREWLWHRMWELHRIEMFPLYVQSAVDEALWDLAGKAAGMPVHELVGTYRQAIPAYASTVTFGSVAEYLDVADQCLQLGYPAIKLHAWGDARKDAELCTALREHVGDDVPLMYDGSAAFDLMDAVYLGRALSDANYLWYEEPMREFSLSAYQSLGERVDVPLLVAEVLDGAHMSTADFIASGCACAVRTSSALKGGITGGLRIAHLAEAHLLRAEVHGTGLANIHLCMSIPNTTYYESLIYSNPVRRAPEVDASGLVHAPTGPGLGYEQLWQSEEPPTLRESLVR
jgi:L-alanine-DL-glutamate epimerase-like enolase superfamily enzyme